MLKKLHFIINPVSGTDEPVLSYIAKAFKDTDIDWDVSVTKKEGDAKFFAQELLKSDVDAVCVYGGDGTVAHVAQALMHSNKPMIILPGGTANVMAKEILMPNNTVEALNLIKDDKLEEQTVDMGMCGDTPFLLRINIGFVADMTENADPKFKEMFGQLAYGVTAVQHIMQSPIQTYTITLDGVESQVEGAAVVIANVCNMGVAGMSFAPGAEIYDGKLDVFVMHRTDFGSVAKAIGNILRQQSSDDVYSHWKATDVKVKLNRKQSIVCDDFPVDIIDIHARIVPQALRLYVPKKQL